MIIKDELLHINLILVICLISFQARVHLTELLQFLAVAPVDQAVVEQALNLPYEDFEDAVQMLAAVRSGADYLVTRNVPDFKAGPLPVIRPAELLVLLQL